MCKFFQRVKVPYSQGCTCSIIRQLAERRFRMRYATKEAIRQNPVLAVYRSNKNPDWWDCVRFSDRLTAFQLATIRQIISLCLNMYQCHSQKILVRSLNCDSLLDICLDNTKILIHLLKISRRILNSHYIFPFFLQSDCFHAISY